MKSNLDKASKGTGGLHIVSGKSGTLLGKSTPPKTAMPTAGGGLSGVNKRAKLVLGKNNQGNSSLRGK